MKMLVTEKYRDKISGIINCYDRINIRCSAGMLGYADGMEMFFNILGRRCFDFHKVFEPVTEAIKKNAEKIASENNLTIEYVRNVGAFRKDDKIADILAERGEHEGIVKIYSQLEMSNTYKPWTDKETGKTGFKFDKTKCLHYYFYFVDRKLGLCFVKVPTIAPFTATIYFNGHGLLESKLKAANIGYQRQENAFVHIEDYKKAQELSDKIRVEDIHSAFDAFMRKYCPLPREWDLGWNYSISQIEYAMDIIWKKQDELKPVYDNIIKTAMHTVTPENIASFLGKRLTVKFEGEMGSRYNERVLGTRIKHQMGEISVKVYDKFGKVLRIEVTAWDVSKLNTFRDVFKRNGEIEAKVAPVKKNIYSLFVLASVFKAIIMRYLEFISSFDDPTSGIKKLESVTSDKKMEKKTFKGLNFFNKQDESILMAIANGKYTICGLRAKDLKSKFPDLPSWKISNILARLKNLGLLRRIKNSYKYHVTSLGKSVIVAGLHLKNQVIVPALATS
jgi:hypothetical protein